MPQDYPFETWKGLLQSRQMLMPQCLPRKNVKLELETIFLDSELCSFLVHPKFPLMLGTDS